MTAVVNVHDLVVDYSSRTHTRRAVDHVSFSVAAGTTLAVVGESGAGKSTIGRVLTGLTAPTAGSIEVCGEDRSLPATRTSERRRRAAQLQLVPQDPFTSVDPRHTVGGVLREALAVHAHRPARRDLDLKVGALLDQVGLQEHHAGATPVQLSGGQLQRVAIARAVAVEPPVIVLDEAVSALDVSVQAQVLNLLRGLQRRTGVAFVFITHDLGVVRQIADQVLVLRAGRVVEHGPIDAVLGDPQDAYTRLLIASTPQPGWTPVRRDAFLSPAAADT